MATKLASLYFGSDSHCLVWRPRHQFALPAREDGVTGIMAAFQLRGTPRLPRVEMSVQVLSVLTAIENELKAHAAEGS
jgi:hypothetical protein